MLKKERQRYILMQLEQNDFVTLESLMRDLDSSESTIRRDLDELETSKQLRRVHGGAQRITTLTEELSNVQKSVKNVQEKKMIAEKALSLINDGDVIFIDPGTTTDAFVDLLDNTTITVVTNSLQHASKLLAKGMKTYVIGGFLKQNTDAAVGVMALDQIHRMHFDKAFMGMNAINESHLSTPDLEEAAVKTAIINNSRQTYILADHSKLNRQSFAIVAPIEVATLIINQHTPSILPLLKERTTVIEV